MLSDEEEPVEAFKNVIGFKSEARRAQLAGQIAIPWPKPSEWPSFTKEEWKEEDHRVYSEPNSVLEDYIFSRTEEEFAVSIFVAQKRNDDAIDYLFQRATSTTKAVIPFVVGPRDLGHFSLTNSNPEVSDLYWVFYNVCVHIHRTDRNADIMPLARYLQLQMQKGIVPSVEQARPKFERIEASSTRVPVGGAFSTWIVFHQAFPASYLDIQIEFDRNRLEFRGSSELDWTLKGKLTGRAEITFHATDKRTLLRNSSSVYIDVVD